MCYYCSLCSVHHNVSVAFYYCYVVIDVSNLLFKLYVAFADNSFVFIYREVNAISRVENGAPILKRKSGEEFLSYCLVIMTTPSIQKECNCRFGTSQTSLSSIKFVENNRNIYISKIGLL